MKNISEIITKALKIGKRKAQKRAELRALLEDPDLADDVAELFDEIRNSRMETTYNVDPPGIERVKLRKPGVQSGVRDAIRSLRETLPERFTAQQVLNALQHQSFEFGADPRSSVRDALYALTKDGHLKILTRGKGGKPNIYQFQTK